MTLPVHETFNVTIGTAATEAVMVKPSGLVAGNTLWVILCTDGAGESIQPPTDTWVNGSTNVSNTMTIRTFWKNATATDVAATDFTFTWGSTEAVVAGITRLSGCDLSGIVVDTMAIATGASSTPTCPSVTTTVPDCLVYRFFGCDDDELAVENAGYPGGTTGVYARVSGVAVGGDCTSGLAHEPQVSAGSTGTAAFTIDGSEGWVAMTIAIREPQNAPTGTDVQVQHFHWTLPTGTGNASFTGLDFTPKGLIFFGNAATGGGATADALFWQGLVDDTNEFSISSYGEDGAQNTQRHTNETTGVMSLLVPGATEDFAGTWVSFNSDGFTFNFSNGAPSDTIAHGIAIGGSDAEIFCGSVDADVTGSIVSTGFRTDLIFSMNLGLGLGGADSAHAIQSVGLAARNRDQGVDDISSLIDQCTVITYQGNDTADQTNKHSVLETDIFTGQQFQNARTWGIRMDHVTGNEFTWGDTENSDGFYFIAVHVAGLKCAVGNFAKSTGGAPAAQSLPDLGFVPQAYGLISGGKANTVNTPAADGSVSIGNLSDRGSLVQGSVAMHDLNDAIDANQRQEAGILMQFLGATDTLVAEAIGDAVTDSTPSFTWDPNDAVAKLIGYWAIEEEPAPGEQQNPVIVGTNF